MSAGHKHRTVRVKRGGLVHRLLTRPTLLRTRNLAWVERSRLVFGYTDTFGVWRLSPLGLLHGLTGLTLDTR